MTACPRCGLPLHIGGGTHPNAENCIASLKATLAGATEAGQYLRAERDELLADVAAAEAPLTDIVLRHHAAMSQVERERDEARVAFLECALAIGVAYEADGHAPAPGPLDEVVHYIREARQRSMEHIDCEMSPLNAKLREACLERDEARGLLRDVDTAWSDCLLTEDQADVLERIVAHLGAK